MHIAAISDDKNALECLLRHIPSGGRQKAIEDKNFDESATPMHYAAAHGCASALEFLIKAGAPAPIEAKMQDQATPLWLAASHDQPETLACLYRYGASISETCKPTGVLYWWLTPLQIAERLNMHRARICLELLHAWEKKFLSDKDSDAPNCLIIPLEEGFKGSMLGLFKINLGTFLMKACFEGFEQMVIMFLAEPHTIVNVKGPQGNTALHYAAQKGYAKIISLLLTKNDAIDVNIQNEEGNTALHLASRGGHREVIRLLHDRNTINVDLKNKKGLTALELEHQHAQLIAATSGPISIN